MLIVDVFIVTPDEQDRLVALLASATSAVVDQAFGFVSATPHKSVDRTKVTMSAKWRSGAD